MFTALLLLCTTMASAQDFEVDGIYYNITDATNKTVEVAKSNYTGSITIPVQVTNNNVTYTVTSIRSLAFYYCSGLTSVEIPNSVTAIQDQTFEYCTNLQSITIPSSVKSIGYRAFENCQSLQTVNLSEGLNSIGVCAFQYCVNLQSVVIPSSVATVNSYAFRDCTKLADVTFNSTTAPSAGDAVFDKISSSAVLRYPAGSDYSGWSSYFARTEEYATTIGGSCGANVNWTLVDGVLTITGSGEMDDLSYNTIPWKEYRGDIKAVVIEDGVTNIGAYAFDNCSGITSVVIGNSVTSIGEYAFYNCTGLTCIEIPNSVTSIEMGAFNGCSGLTSIEIPYSVTSIGTYAFQYCYRLASIVVDEGNTVFDSRDNCNAIIYTASNTIVLGCYNTTFPNSVTSIGGYAFSGCFWLISIEIPNSVTSIGGYAFSECYGLSNIVIPSSVTSIGYSAFNLCTRLTSVTSYIPADNLFYTSAFYDVDVDACTLYVPYGAKTKYASTSGWNYFTKIVELRPSEITITINQYGSGTYCSDFALDFSNVEGLKAYAATGYNVNTGVITLTRLQTAREGTGLFLKGEPGDEYVVPVLEETGDHSLNMLVGTLKETTVNSISSDDLYANYMYTIMEDADESTPMFYRLGESIVLPANKAYLQIPLAWLQASASKSVEIRFDDGETTDIDEVEGENGDAETVYDLQGRAVENPTKGIYIVDGKKVFIK